jgi:SH3 domain-containing YSC84-like protein 1
MNRSITPWIAVLSLVALGFAPATRAETKADELSERLQDAKATFQELTTSPDHGVPQELMEHAKCIAVIPHVIKAAVGVGARHGKGVIVCRDGSGSWGTPAFVTLSGGSFGLQLGAESTDLVLFFMNDRGARSLMNSSKFTLGGKASVAAGPVGRSAEAGTDLKLNAEIYSYAKSKGLFAGLSLEGARLAPDDKANRIYYSHTARQILFDHSGVQAPVAADEFSRSLP